MIRTVVLIILMAPINLLIGQGHWESPVPSTKRTGYFNLDLSPELTSHLEEDAANLRLYDGESLEIPYLFNSEVHARQTVDLRWYPKVGGKHHRRWYSRAIFENARRNAISEIVLKIRNAEVRQRFWLSGSDDMQNWYIIKEDFAYDAAYDPASTFNLLTLQFPKVDYHYYKVEIRHYWREPIEIMGAGFYEVADSKGAYSEIKGLEVAQMDDSLGKKSFIDIDLGENHYLDRLHFIVDGPEMYYRKASLEVTQGVDFRKSIAVTSEEVTQLQFKGLRCQKLRLTINNQDDQPIRIVGLRAYQLKRSLTAKLEEAKGYHLEISKGEMALPEYDIKHFSHKIPKNRRDLKIDSITFQNPEEVAVVRGDSEVKRVEFPGPDQEEPELENPKPFYEEKWVLWLGIVVVAAIMLWFSVGMLREKD